MDNILIVGTGGREHALGWNLSQSHEIEKVSYVSAEEKFETIRRLIERKKIALTIIGPEGPLAAGIVDFLSSKGVDSVFGPTREMARIESDKFHSYDLMEDLGIPQAHSIKCFSASGIREAIRKFEEPVLKYRWLKAGKGVRVYSSQKEAESDLESFVKEIGGEALVAERLHGQEISVFGIADGKNLLPFEIAFQDHKPAYAGDKGPNTGGMGACGPVPIAPVELVRTIAENVMLPVVKRINYRGFLYAGMILTEEGPKVIEFNARFGDPEAQSAMMLLKNSLYDPIRLSLEGKVSEALLSFREGASCCVVLASKGYPGKYKKGFPISGIEEAEKIPGIKVFHAGTKLKHGVWFTDGGRVLGVTSRTRAGIKEAQRLTYEAVPKINIPGGFHYRPDIGDKALKCG